jgi:hypothetical protein
MGSISDECFILSPSHCSEELTALKETGVFVVFVLFVVHWSEGVPHGWGIRAVHDSR